MLPVANAIWIGPELGLIHAACLISFTRHGHKVVLHCYEEPSDVPKGIELSDARLLMPQDRLFVGRKTGSYAFAADLLRYEILRVGLGLYIDCDVYCLKPVPDADYIIGWQTGDSINNAVLKLPPGCPALAELCKLKDQRYFIPPWQPKARQRRWRFQRMIGLGKTLADLPWGTIGPDALTWYLRKLGLDHHARPSDVFYPVAHYHTHRFFDPGLIIDDLVTPRTLAVHLYNETFRNRPIEDIHPDSPVGKMISGAAWASDSRAAAAR